MTIDEAIIYAEEETEEQEKLAKRYDDASGYTRSHNESIRTSDAKRCIKRADEHRQIAEWLKDYKRLLDQEPTIIEASDIQPDDAWMQETEWDEIYAKEMEG